MKSLNRNAYTPELNKQRSEKMRGRKVYNNGIEQIYVNAGQSAPDGFVLGSLPIYNPKKATTKGTLTYTNGKTNIHLLPGEMPPAEFYRGSCNKGFKHSAATRKKFKEQRIGGKYCTNGTRTIRIVRGAPIPDGFHAGVSQAWCELRRELSTGVKQSEATIEKRFNTMRANHTLNSSRQEQLLYEHLCSLFGADDIEAQYKDARYPFACDFYIKSLDLFIELNYHWTHCDHPFLNSVEDKKLLLEINNKAASSNFYKINKQVWTERDPLKLKTMQDNNLNYVIIYKETYVSNMEDELCQKIIKW